MDMQQMIECLLAGQKQMLARTNENQERMDAKMDTNQSKKVKQKETQS
jgi:hypothetical protein